MKKVLFLVVLFATVITAQLKTTVYNEDITSGKDIYIGEARVVYPSGSVETHTMAYALKRIKGGVVYVGSFVIKGSAFNIFALSDGIFDYEPSDALSRRHTNFGESLQYFVIVAYRELDVLKVEFYVQNKRTIAFLKF